MDQGFENVLGRFFKPDVTAVAQQQMSNETEHTAESGQHAKGLLQTLLVSRDVINHQRSISALGSFPVHGH